MDVFFAPNQAGALSLLFPFTRRHYGGDDPGGRPAPLRTSRFREAGVTCRVARPWPRPGTIGLCLEAAIPMKVRNRIIFACCRARAGRLHLQLFRACQHELLRCQKRHPYPWYHKGLGAKAIIDWYIFLDKKGEKVLIWVCTTLLAMYGFNSFISQCYHQTPGP
jgi:hypothetical protein